MDLPCRWQREGSKRRLIDEVREGMQIAGVSEVDTEDKERWGGR